MYSKEATRAYESYKALTKAREKSKNFQTRTFKNRILKLRRSRPNPKTGGYFVSNKGLPTNSGIRFDQPIDVETFRKITLKDWDKVYFERGQVYNWLEYEITTNNNTVGSYGSGASPKFYGSSTLSANEWTSESGGYYKTALATAPLWVTIDGECARQGETDWIVSTAVATSTTITGAAATLNAFNSVEALANNAKLRHKEFNFRYSYEHLVTGYNTGTGVLTIGAGGVSTAATGLPFKLYGQKQYATLEGDWWYDDANNELWIKTASDPTGSDIRVITENYAFNVQGSNCTIENIEFTQYFESAIEAPDAPNLTLSGFTVHDNRQNGLLLYGNNTTLTLSNFTIQRCGLQGIHLGAVSASTISDFTIHDIGLQDNIGWPVDTYWIKTGGCAIAYFWDSGETRTTALNVDVTGGEMYNLGYMGILIVGDNHDITECIAHDFCLKWNDGGGFYTIHRAAQAVSTKNITFTRCAAYHGVGNVDGIGADAISLVHAEGFYVDNGCELVTIDECISYENSDRGIVINWDTQKTTITNCTVFGNGTQQVIYREDEGTPSPVFSYNNGNVFTGNLIIATGLDYCVMAQNHDSDANYNPFSNGGSIDNNIYVRPYGTTVNASKATATGNVSTYNLAAWQTHISGDASSVEKYESSWIYKNPILAAEEVKVSVNLTDSPITVDATGYNDISGTPLGASEPVAAWSTLVYFIATQPTPDLLLDTFTAANGTNLSGRSPNVGPTPIIAAGTHTISTNEWISSVNGRVTWNVNAADVYFTIRTLMTNISNGLNSYFRRVDENNRFVIATTATTLIMQERNNSATATKSWVVPYEFAINRLYFFSIAAIGTNVKVWVNGQLLIDDTTSYTAAGEVGALGGTTRRTDFILAETV